ncbi:MAG: hypothetical protein IMW92_14330 [Bacillales bacterium]|nr:hypothetical protein [Bacillales bacterium]
MISLETSSTKDPVTIVHLERWAKGIYNYEHIYGQKLDTYVAFEPHPSAKQLNFSDPLYNRLQQWYDLSKQERLEVLRDLDHEHAKQSGRYDEGKLDKQPILEILGDSPSTFEKLEAKFSFGLKGDASASFKKSFKNNEAIDNIDYKIRIHPVLISDDLVNNKIELKKTELLLERLNEKGLDPDIHSLTSLNDYDKSIRKYKSHLVPITQATMLEEFNDQEAETYVSISLQHQGVNPTLKTIQNGIESLKNTYDSLQKMHLRFRNISREVMQLSKDHGIILNPEDEAMIRQNAVKETVLEAMETTLHEGRHIYQFQSVLEPDRLKKHVDPEVRQSWEKQQVMLENQVKDDPYWLYRMQSVEVDAYMYGSTAKVDILTKHITFQPSKQLKTQLESQLLDATLSIFEKDVSVLKSKEPKSSKVRL